MFNFTKPFRGVKAGEIYPTDFNVGDECPAELAAGAKSVGAIDGASAPPPVETAGQKFVAGKAADVIASVADQKDIELLTQARDAEAASQNPRKTVLEAIDAAIATLSNPPA